MLTCLVIEGFLFYPVYFTQADLFYFGLYLPLRFSSFGFTFLVISLSKFSNLANESGFYIPEGVNTIFIDCVESCI